MNNCWLAALLLTALTLEASASASQPPPGAMACTGCHPTAKAVDTPLRRLSELTPRELISMMQEFRTGQRPATVMDRIAKGFSDEELQAIATWFRSRH